MDGYGRTETIPAKTAHVGGTYRTSTGIRVIVRRKTARKVVLWSAATGHLVAVSPEYRLIPVWEMLFEFGA